MIEVHPFEASDEMFRLSKANWEPYMGNNHLRITPPQITAGGTVSFTEHIGKPLSQDLWEDLIHRLCISGLGVYGWHDCQWLVGRSQGYCIIKLDENENVRDIRIFPYQRYQC